LAITNPPCSSISLR